VGLLAVFVALVSPVAAMSGVLLSAHMGQHFILLMVAAPLLVLGAPGIVLSVALPPTWRQSLHRLGRRRWARVIGRATTNPAVAWLLAGVTLWTWHLPRLYQVALRSEPIHVLEHATFLGTALLFWWTALQPSGRRRLARGADVLYVFTGAFQGMALGALLAFASTPLYPFYVGRARGWGLTPLQDQQLAGVIMWIPSGVIYLVLACVLFVRWMTAMEREVRRDERHLIPLRR
jgi:cytochrome c oxidase assembly factor CtaG